MVRKAKKNTCQCPSCAVPVPQEHGDSDTVVDVVGWLDKTGTVDGMEHHDILQTLHGTTVLADQARGGGKRGVFLGRQSVLAVPWSVWVLQSMITAGCDFIRHIS